MKRFFSIGLFISCLLVVGCLDFGKDEQTTSPTSAQVARCRAEMYLKPSLTMSPLGFKLEGSGIDDAIWFKFQTSVSDPSEVFDISVVDVTTLRKGFTFSHEMKELPWWDVRGKDLLGAQVPLPRARFMNIGMHKVPTGYIIYIMWHET